MNLNNPLFLFFWSKKERENENDTLSSYSERRMCVRLPIQTIRPKTIRTLRKVDDTHPRDFRERKWKSIGIRHASACLLAHFPLFFPLSSRFYLLFFSFPIPFGFFQTLVEARMTYHVPRIIDKVATPGENSSSPLPKSSNHPPEKRDSLRNPWSFDFFSNKLRDLSFVDFFSEYYNHFQYFSCFCFLFLYQLYKHSSSETYEFLISRDILSLKFKFL